MYVDGQLDGSAAYTVAPNSVGQPLQVGQYRYGNRNFRGNIDEVKLYDYARSAEQIRVDAGLVSGPTATPTATPTWIPTPTPTATPTPTLQPAITSTVVSPDSGGSLSSQDNSIVLSFPAGSVATTTIVSCTQEITPTASLGSFQFAGRAFSIEATDQSGQPVTTFTRPFTLTLTYDDEDWQSAGISSEEKLNLYFWNGNAWIALLPCAGCSRDIQANRILVLLDHLTEFGLLACPLPADVVPDGTVNQLDVQSVADRWRQPAGSPYDLDGDGKVTVADIMRVAAAWGSTCE
jgi:hypothetical protein